MNIMMIGAVEEFLKCFGQDFAIIRASNHPMGGFVLEKFLIKKCGPHENAYLSIELFKNDRRFLPKTKSPRSVCSNFFYPPR